ncbi:hypothetical protein MVEN_01887500 [Mycena venus]|uniref:Uncharacterized protein n=1 Tax=Mycena venus TaxID=2733690 RepID=A0A8H7CL04_9AGAR|nr:hypothetical protein MVEN_01887500 [Mycena venus]
MTGNSQWSYRAATTPGSLHTTIHIQTMPHALAQRRSAALAPYQAKCPPTPRIPFLPLPGQVIYSRPQIPALFPIDLSQVGLSSVHMALLSDTIPPFTMISVQAAAGYVLCKVKTGSSVMSTADFVQFLQYLVRTALPPYSDLSPTVQQSVKDHFISRHGSHGPARWARFVSGTPRFGFPTGHDILLGNVMLWTLDPDPLGVWVATVDVPRPRYPTW